MENTRCEHELTSSERDTVERARVVAGLADRELRVHTREHDPVLAMASALGEAQHLLREMADLVAELTER
jgi:hypothetical protein